MPAEERPNDRIGIERAGGWPEEERVGRTTRPGVAATQSRSPANTARCETRVTLRRPTPPSNGVN